MKIAVAADERTGVAGAVVEQLRERGHEPVVHGALAEGERVDWAWCCEAAARDVAEGRAEQAVVCCWTGTGASIAANKVPGIRAALCGDAATAAGGHRDALLPETDGAVHPDRRAGLRHGAPAARARQPAAARRRAAGRPSGSRRAAVPRLPPDPGAVLSAQT